jgi:hypothetical protein
MVLTAAISANASSLGVVKDLGSKGCQVAAGRHDLVRDAIYVSQVRICHFLTGWNASRNRDEGNSGESRQSSLLWIQIFLLDTNHLDLDHLCKPNDHHFYW